jgi:hypothetical protein
MPQRNRSRMVPTGGALLRLNPAWRRGCPPNYPGNRPVLQESGGEREALPLLAHFPAPEPRLETRPG